MAITAPTKLSDFDSGFLPPGQSGPIFERAKRSSVVMGLVRQTPMGINGQNITTVTGKLTASWVNEGEQKEASEASLGLVTLVPKKLATIAVVSEEVVRANPGGFMQEVTDQVGEAFGIAFDAATLHGTNTPFTTYLDQTTKAVEIGTTTQANGGVHGDLVAGLSALVTDGKRLNGWALDDVIEPTLLASVDSSGRPLYVDLPTGDDGSVGAFPSERRNGRLLSRPAYMREGVATTDLTSVVGYGGDWTQAVWGQIGGISYKVSTEASVTINGALVSLFENNLVAILAEAEYGWLVNDVEAFLKLTNAL